MGFLLAPLLHLPLTDCIGTHHTYGRPVEGNSTCASNEGVSIRRGLSVDPERIGQIASCYVRQKPGEILGSQVVLLDRGAPAAHYLIVPWLIWLWSDATSVLDELRLALIVFRSSRLFSNIVRLTSGSVVCSAQGARLFGTFTPVIGTVE
jgi:hypothetical protein